MFKHALTSFVFLFILLSSIFLFACSPSQNANIESDFNHVIIDSSAHWLTPDWLVLKAHQNASKFVLRSENQAGDINEIELVARSLPTELTAKYPHLSHFRSFFVPATSTNQWIKTKLTVNQIDDNDQHVAISHTQLYGVLDALFTANAKDANEIEDFGATVLNDGQIQFKIWAPTASQVSVNVYDDSLQLTHTFSLVEQTNTGVWSVKTEQANELDYYQYHLSVYHYASQGFEQVTTTDPYSLSLSTNSKYSQVVNLQNELAQPNGWNSQSVVTVAAPEDLILYETHIRDFSASDTALSDPSYRGKYKAFSELNSNGIKHLTMLKEAGLNTVHLLPTYDISTVDEEAGVAIDILDSVEKMCSVIEQSSFCQNTSQYDWTIKQLLQSFTEPSLAQDLMEQIRGFDNYNWGYDPYHYTVPEGSYAVNPNGVSRIVEFREMVTSLHNMGFRVIMDVVYNHTFASGLNDKSVLDKVVPGYYHRRNPISGKVEQSTCCDNTATEHAMMEKLMIDSLIVWARDYKIDGFRFDLMGHQPKAAMLKARDAVRAVDPDTYFYGEGWNFGEVANNAQFIQASQTELAGTEIGTFTDRLRDAVRGGNFQSNAEGLRHDQGIGNGLYVITNELQPSDGQINEYHLSIDQVRLGLAGNLAEFSFTNNQGQVVSGTDVQYGGGIAGYAHDPADTINYVSKHDNQTLWDINQYKFNSDLTSDQRVRMHIVSLSFPLFAQGIPFIHMGSELLRSKSFLRDSYDYGDWFNAVDFSYQSNNYDVGLPPADKDQSNWPVITNILTNNAERDDVSAQQIEHTAMTFSDLLRIRTSSPLFRLTSAEQIQTNVKFHNTGTNHQAGLIVMELYDTNNLDENFESIVVVFNIDDEDKHFAFSRLGYQLHPIQKEGHDNVVKQAMQDNDVFYVPAMTTAVFVK